MLGVAHTERKIDDPEGAAQAIMKARSALESAKQFLPALKNVPVAILYELRRGINELESALLEYEFPATRI
jgi:hypothetical protein